MKKRILSGLFSVLLLAWVIACSTAFAQQANPAAAASAPQAGTSEAQTDAQKRQESFEIVWKTINQRFYDPTFGGVDWNRVHERYAPLVARANSDRELHLVLQQMLNELHQSHFVIIPKESIPKLIPKRKSAKSSDSDEAEDAADIDDLSVLDDKAPTTPLDRIGYKLTERLSTGIGIDLRVMSGSAVITRVQPGSAAARAGLRPGFVIRSVGGESLDLIISRLEQNPIFQSILRAEMPLVLVAGFINGERRSPVQLVYLDGRNRPRAVSITREQLKGEMSAAIGNLPALYTEFESRQLPGGFGYIRFNAFVPALMKKACAAMRSMHDARGLIIDLRGNQGGLLGMVSGLTGLLKSHPVALGTMQTRTGRGSVIAFPQRVPYSGPVVILIDSTTQSAAEMFASGLQETGRAVIVGEQSAGNTLPSVIMKLPTGALFQYGFANYQTLAGNVVEGHGIVPDVSARLSRRSLLRGTDRQMAAAIRKIRELASATESAGRSTGILIADAPPVASKTPSTTAPGSKTQTTPKQGAAVTVVAGTEKGDPKSAPPPPPPRVLSLPEASSENPKPAAAGPSVDQIIDRYIEAIGGRSALEKLTSRVSRGTVELASMGLNGQTEIYEKTPNRSSMIINIDGLGVIQETFDGVSAWLQDPVRGYIKFSSQGAATARKEAEFQKEIRLRELNPGLALIGKEKVGEREAYVLQSRSPAAGIEKWYFDVQTGLLLRKGNTYYEDYREVDGVKLPFTTRDDSDGFGIVTRLSEIKHNVAIDAAKFVEYPDCFTSPERIQGGTKKDLRVRP